MRYALYTLAALLLLAAALVYAAYARTLAATSSRLAAGSRMAYTPCGPIEYAVRGRGPAVLLVHGSGGGYSQTAALAERLAAGGLQAISMSRFGYLRTPMPADASAEAQADAHACLLDALGVGSAAAFGASAGAPSAMQFCLRHGDRCTALVLLVPAAYHPGRTARQSTPPSPLMQPVLDHVLTSDFVVWAITRAWPEVLIETVLATPVDVFRHSSTEEQRRALDLIRDIFPVGAKLQGLRHDTQLSAALPRYPLERMAAPALVISVQDDLYGTAASARYTAGQITGARLLIYPTGGHAWMGHDAEVSREITRFLQAAAAGHLRGS